MYSNIKIAPSILSADFSKMGEEVKMLEKSGADLIHCDVMDGVFVKNISFGPKMVKDIRKYTVLPLDCHLMIVNPEKYVGVFADSGADIITVHYETCGDNLINTLKLIKSYNVKCGAVINPDTSADKLEEALEYCDMVLLMSVFPGFGGQKFIDSVYDKLSILKEMIKKTGKKIDLEVDGGINLETAATAIEKGANVLVAGNTVFSSCDIKQTMQFLEGKKN